MLCTLGDLLEDLVVWMPEDPQRGGDLGVRIHRGYGGSAASVAALVAGAGGRSRFVGQVGDDRLGTELVAALEQLGVDTRVARSGRSGCRVVLVSADGESTELVDRGAATQLTMVPPDALEGVEVLHIPCATLVADPLATSAYELIGEATERGVRVTFDAGTVRTLEEFGIVEFLDLVAQVRPSVLLCDGDAARLLGMSDDKAAPGTEHTVVQVQDGPTVLISADGPTRTIEAAEVDEIVDRHGIRDAFAAGYLLGMLAGQDPVTAIRAAHLLVSRVLRAPGTGLART